MYTLIVHFLPKKTAVHFFCRNSPKKRLNCDTSVSRGQKKNRIMWEKFPNWGEGSDPNPLHIFSNSGAYRMAKNTVKNVKIPKLGGGGMEGVRHLGIFPT